MISLLPTLLLPLLVMPRYQETETITSVSEDALQENLRWRHLGPATMGGRVLDLAVHPDRPQTFYVASATGGLFKTVNHGTTFAAVFENEGSSSVGAVALAPSRPDVVYVGTGEANPRNSVSWGDGVYRSEDGGQSWVHCGLPESRHIGAIAVHPNDPDTLFVAAMGSTWGPGEARGLYRSRNGGASFELVLSVDDRTGCIDVIIDPEQPQIIYAATYERQRDELDGNDPAIRTGPGSGIWRSSDGGDRWEALQRGLPTLPMGRIGLDLCASDPRIVFAVVETERTGERGAPPRSSDRVSLGIKGRDDDASGFLIEAITEGESAAQAGLEAGDRIVRVDSTAVLDRASLVGALSRYQPGDEAEVVYLREGEESVTTLVLLGRLLRSQARSFAGSQGGQVANAHDQQGEEGFETGGVFRSEDRGTTWKRINSLNPRPFYYSQVRVDPGNDRLVYVLGIDLHRSIDGGETFEVVRARIHPDHHALWIDPRDPDHLLLGNDGGLYASWDGATTFDHLDVLPIAQFYNVAVDMQTPYRVYGGLQDNGSWGGPSALRGAGAENADWIRIGGGDGFRCAVPPDRPHLVYSESQNGAISRVDLRTGERLRVTRPGNNQDYRFNWNTPFLLSAHNSDILYHAGNRVFRSLDGGAHSELISPEITRTDRGSATALAESSLDKNTLYVGSDDGALFQTLDGGQSWVSVVERLPGMVQPLYVSDIEVSPHRADVVYVTLDGHRSNDFRPHVFVSEDDGETFRSLAAGLPAGGPVRTLAVDPVQPSLLFVGTEFACFVSLDAGEHWMRMGNGLPTVPVHDLVIHPREADLVAATHGRGVWVVDISPLQELSSERFTGAPHLFAIRPVHLWNDPPRGETSGSRHFVADRAPTGAAIYYHLPEETVESVQLVIRDVAGDTLRALPGESGAGLHRVNWDLRADRRAAAGRGAPGRGDRRGGAVEWGDYSVTLQIGEARAGVGTLRVLPDPAERDFSQASIAGERSRP